MSLPIFLSVLVAAFLHAVWNALVKGGHDKHVGMCAVVIGQGVFGLAAIPVAPMPAAESVPYLIASVTLHMGYQMFLLFAYIVGDLTQVYPIARGVAPLIVAGVSVGLLGVSLGQTEMAAILMIAAGIISLGLVRQRDGLRNGKAAVLALVTGCFIAAYSLVDGQGARAAGTSLGFYAWGAVLNAVVFSAGFALVRPEIFGKLGAAWRTIVIGGGASFVAYAIVVHAFTQAPIALVTALRETSIVFALMIGVFFLKERLDLAKLASTALTIGGAALLRLGRG